MICLVKINNKLHEHRFQSLNGKLKKEDIEKAVNMITSC